MATQEIYRWIPKDVTETLCNEYGVVYLCGRASAIAYKGKSGESSFYIDYRKPEVARTEAEKWLAGLVESAKRKKVENEQRKAPHSLKVGDIIFNSWGYDQTNIDWYQVIATSGNFVTVQEIAGDVKENGFMSGTTTPVRDKFLKDSKPERHRVYVHQSGSVSINFEHGSGSLYNGSPRYCSWYA